MRRILQMLSALRAPVYYVEAIRRDGTHRPLRAEFGEREAAARYARLLWVGNTDSNVVGYVVTDGEQDVVFTVPEGAKHD